MTQDAYVGTAALGCPVERSSTASPPQPESLADSAVATPLSTLLTISAADPRETNTDKSPPPPTPPHDQNPAPACSPPVPAMTKNAGPSCAQTPEDRTRAAHLDALAKPETLPTLAPASTHEPRSASRPIQRRSTLPLARPEPPRNIRDPRATPGQEIFAAHP